MENFCFKNPTNADHRFKDFIKLSDGLKLRA